MPELTDYELVKKVGVGAQGSVWKARDRTTGEVVAIKRIDISTLSAEKRLVALNEVKVLMQLQQAQALPQRSSIATATVDPNTAGANANDTTGKQSSDDRRKSNDKNGQDKGECGSNAEKPMWAFHPNICQYRESFIDEHEQALIIVLEWCNGGTLQELFQVMQSAGGYASVRRERERKHDQEASPRDGRTAEQNGGKRDRRHGAASPSRLATHSDPHDEHDGREKQGAASSLKKPTTTYTVAQRKLFKEELVWHILESLCTALQFCHDRGVLHRDVKMANIFLEVQKHQHSEISTTPLKRAAERGDQSSPQNRDSQSTSQQHGHGSESASKGRFPRVVLGDFGVSCVLDDRTKAVTVVGTPYYLSPELCNGEKYGPKSDMWAVGVVLYTILNGRMPFDASNYGALIMQIVTGTHDKQEEIYSPVLHRLAAQCLAKNPSRRPSAADVLELCAATKQQRMAAKEHGGRSDICGVFTAAAAATSNARTPALPRGVEAGGHNAVAHERSDLVDGDEGDTKPKKKSALANAPQLRSTVGPKPTTAAPHVTGVAGAPSRRLLGDLTGSVAPVARPQTVQESSLRSSQRPQLHGSLDGSLKQQQSCDDAGNSFRPKTGPPASGSVTEKDGRLGSERTALAAHALQTKNAETTVEQSLRSDVPIAAPSAAVSGAAGPFDLRAMSDADLTFNFAQHTNVSMATTAMTNTGLGGASLPPHAAAIRAGFQARGPPPPRQPAQGLGLVRNADDVAVMLQRENQRLADAAEKERMVQEAAARREAEQKRLDRIRQFRAGGAPPKVSESPENETESGGHQHDPPVSGGAGEGGKAAPGANLALVPRKIPKGTVPCRRVRPQTQHLLETQVGPNSGRAAGPSKGPEEESRSVRRRPTNDVRKSVSRPTVPVGPKLHTAAREGKAKGTNVGGRLPTGPSGRKDEASAQGAGARAVRLKRSESERLLRQQQRHEADGRGRGGGGGNGGSRGPRYGEYFDNHERSGHCHFDDFSDADSFDDEDRNAPPSAHGGTAKPNPRDIKEVEALPDFDAAGSSDEDLDLEEGSDHDGVSVADDDGEEESIGVHGSLHFAQHGAVSPGDDDVDDFSNTDEEEHEKASDASDAGPSTLVEENATGRGCAPPPAAPHRYNDDLDGRTKSANDAAPDYQEDDGDAAEDDEFNALLSAVVTWKVGDDTGSVSPVFRARGREEGGTVDHDVDRTLRSEVPSIRGLHGSVGTAFGGTHMEPNVRGVSVRDVPQPVNDDGDDDDHSVLHKNSPVDSCQEKEEEEEEDHDRVTLPVETFASPAELSESLRGIEAQATVIMPRLAFFAVVDALRQNKPNDDVTAAIKNGVAEGPSTTTAASKPTAPKGATAAPKGATAAPKDEEKKTARQLEGEAFYLGFRYVFLEAEKRRMLQEMSKR